jgi:hypothetical protein
MVELDKLQDMNFRLPVLQLLIWYYQRNVNRLYKKDISKDETVFASDKWNISASVPNGYRNLG